VRAAELRNALVLIREPWRGRLLARLRAVGVQQFEAEGVVNTMDACALQIALDEADTAPPSDTAERRRRIVARVAAAGRATITQGRMADERVARVAGGPDTPRCRDEAQGDTLGTMPYAMFLREQKVGADGRLVGDVVWARDLGPRDTLLRAEFGGRGWYRYRPGESLEEPAIFVPVAHR